MIRGRDKEGMLGEVYRKGLKGKEYNAEQYTK